MDCAQFFFQNQQGGIAKRVLSNVLELNPEQPIFSRMVAYNLLEFGYYDQAIEILKDIANVLPYEPRSYRDLALAFETIATIQDDDTALTKALNMYYKAIMIDGELDDPVRITALTELNNLIPLAKSKNIRFNKLDNRLKLLIDLDIRVVLSWNNRMTDVDLWTIEPTGEKVFYDNVNGEGGGYLPQDVTTGYGPEEYLNRFSIPGAYKFKAHFYSNGSVEAFGPVTLSMNVYKNYGRENQSVHTATFRIEREEGVVDLGELIIEESKTNLNSLKDLPLETSNAIGVNGQMN